MYSAQHVTEDSNDAKANGAPVQVLRTFGVEVARATVMAEVGSVFGAYGIAVDPRHLCLIADFMTHQASSSACLCPD